MHVDLYGGRPIRCSKCGSTNAVKPVNSRDVALRCGDCGHEKLTADGERRRFEIEHPELVQKSWVSGGAGKEPDRDPTF